MASEYDVAVCGAGPVGLLLANLLGQRGVRTLLLERNPDVFDVPRAIAFDDEMLRACQAVGLYEKVAEDLALDLPARFVNGRCEPISEVKSFPRLFGHSTLGSFYQPHLERVLKEGLARFSCVDARFSHELTDFVQDGRCVRLSGRSSTGKNFRANARYLVGCDGGRSFVRSRLGIELHGSTYAEKWLVIDTRGDTLDDRSVTFYCDPARPAVSVYRNGGRRRWEFLQLPGETEEELLEERKIRELLSTRLDPAGVEIERKAVYTFHARIAERYRESRVLIAGDAAHLTPPFAGQGMNGGMRDAFNLGWKLAAVATQGAPDTILDSYQQERRGHMWRMIQLARFLGTIIMPTDRRLASVRDAVFGTVRRLGAARRMTEHGRLRPRPRVRRSALVHQAGRNSLAGMMLPQPVVEGVGAQGVLLDDVLGTSFALLGYGQDPRRFCNLAERTYFERMGARFVEVAPDGAPLGKSDKGLICVRERGTLLLHWLGRHAGSALLVRPDRFVAAEMSRENAGEIVQWLRELIPGAGEISQVASVLFREAAHG